MVGPRRFTEGVETVEQRGHRTLGERAHGAEVPEERGVVGEGGDVGEPHRVDRALAGEQRLGRPLVEDQHDHGRRVVAELLEGHRGGDRVLGPGPDQVGDRRGEQEQRQEHRIGDAEQTGPGPEGGEPLVGRERGRAAHQAHQGRGRGPGGEALGHEDGEHRTEDADGGRVDESPEALVHRPGALADGPQGQGRDDDDAEGEEGDAGGLDPVEPEGGGVLAQQVEHGLGDGEPAQAGHDEEAADGGLAAGAGVGAGVVLVGVGVAHRDVGRYPPARVPPARGRSSTRGATRSNPSAAAAGIWWPSRVR